MRWTLRPNCTTCAHFKKTSWDLEGVESIENVGEYCRKAEKRRIKQAHVRERVKTHLCSHKDERVFWGINREKDFLLID